MMFGTVQQYLQEADTKALVAAYREAAPISYEMIENKDLTLREIQERSDKRITEFIEYMRTIPLATEKTPAVFFAVPEISEDHDYIDTGVAMCEMEDFKEGGGAPNIFMAFNEPCRSCCLPRSRYSNDKRIPSGCSWHNPSRDQLLWFRAKRHRQGAQGSGGGR